MLLKGSFLLNYVLGISWDTQPVCTSVSADSTKVDCGPGENTLKLREDSLNCLLD